MISDDFKQWMLEGSNEWNEKNGKVTIEASVKLDNIPDILKYTEELTLINGKWVVFSCETCRGYQGEEYAHLEIQKDWWE